MRACARAGPATCRACVSCGTRREYIILYYRDLTGQVEKKSILFRYFIFFVPASYSTTVPGAVSRGSSADRNDLQEERDDRDRRTRLDRSPAETRRRREKTRAFPRKRRMRCGTGSRDMCYTVRSRCSGKFFFTQFLHRRFRFWALAFGFTMMFFFSRRKTAPILTCR